MRAAGPASLRPTSHPSSPFSHPAPPTGEPLTADDLGVGGALTVLMKDTIEPTLMQVGAGAAPASAGSVPKSHAAPATPSTTCTSRAPRALHPVPVQPAPCQQRAAAQHHGPDPAPSELRAL